jgi:hypothetical protein
MKELGRKISETKSEKNLRFTTQEKQRTSKKNLLLISFSFFLLIAFHISVLSDAMIIPKPSSISNDFIPDVVHPNGLFDQVIYDNVIHFKVPDNAFNMTGMTDKKRLNYRVFAYPSDTPVEVLDEVDGFPVLVSFLNDHDLKFRNQPNSGISMNNPYVVFMTRVPDFRQVVSFFSSQKVIAATNNFFLLQNFVNRRSYSKLMT